MTDRNDSEDATDTSLSSDGTRRRDAILLDAIALGTRLRRRRNLLRATLVAAPVLVVAVVAVVATHLAAPGPRRSPGVAPMPVAIGPPSTRPMSGTTRRASPVISVVRVGDDPTILARYAAGPATPRVRRIGDDELLAALAAAGLRGGLMTVGDRTTLLADANEISR